EDITLEHAEAVADARAAFEGLTEAQQALVSTTVKEKLEAAEAKIQQLETEAAADREAVNAVETQIETL
ncbi:putative porin, partial [Neobacillus mesonae]|nr:putative porin [Neobacillus mesonae]